MTLLPGVGGSLFPSRFLASVLRPDPSSAFLRGRFDRWWHHVESNCGPATGLRALFDLVAMPLAAMLGFRARDAIFTRDCVHARLVRENESELLVQLLVLPWAERPTRRWRELAANANGARWCLIVAAPFVSVVDLRGHALRRSIDFHLPDALDARSFHAFWMVCRAATLASSEADRLVSDAAAFQDSVRDDLQLGVASALASLGPILRAQGVEDDAERRFGEALTLVYRVLFLLFAESRALAPVHHPRYGPTYSLTALCRDAMQATPMHAGLWDGLAAITRLSRVGCETADLVAKPFNGRLFARATAPALESHRGARPTRISMTRDRALGSALIALATRQGIAGREEISYADLGVEQLGAVYERVLDLDPSEALQTPPKPAAASRRAHSVRRKESGTFYTPQPLAEFVIRRTLSPLVQNTTSDDILALRVVDPSMGSGAFLVAACRFLADAYEHAIVEEGRCAETDLGPDTRAGIRRLIASRCLAGVDANPVAVQLARLSLWLATLSAGKPLGFLDHQLRCGDSLVGASPDDLWRLSSRNNNAAREAPLFEAAGLEAAIRGISAPWRRLRDGHDDTVDDVRHKEKLWSVLEGERSPLAPWRTACNAWCARWFWPRTSSPPSAPELRAVLDAVLRQDRTLQPGRVRERIASATEIARTHRFFHWPLEFADLFYDADGAPRPRAGFHAVIGNPPWEMLRGGGDDSRRDLVTFLRGSGLYPACDRGHLNLYQAFLERSLALARPGGRVGLVLPWSLAVDEGAMSLRRRLFHHERVETIVGLDNGAGLFPIHRGLRFMVLVAAAGAPRRTTLARFGVRTAIELDDLPGSTSDDGNFPIRLTVETIERAGGPALRIPDARSPADLEWLTAVSTRFPRLSVGWRAEFGRELNATEDRHCFGVDGLPVIEGKHIAPFRVNLDESSALQHIRSSDAARLLPAGGFRNYRLAYRDVAGAGNRLTLIAAIVPANVVTTHTLFCLKTTHSAEHQLFLCALFNSSVLNRIVRMLMGSHVTTGLVESLPVPIWTGADDQLRLVELARQLSASPADRLPSLQHELDELVSRMYA